MDKVLPVERPFWFSITMPADPRLAPVLRDLSVRIARQVGCAGENADRFGATLAEAVSQAIGRGQMDPGGAHVEARFRVNLSAFEVTLLLKADDERAAAALAGADPARVWSRDALEGVTDRFEVSRVPDGIRCRVTRVLSKTQQ
jgi:hypothetical protein